MTVLFPTSRIYTTRPWWIGSLVTASVLVAGCPSDDNQNVIAETTATTCPPGQIVCNELCVDPDTSPSHCGASDDCVGETSGSACEPGFVCDGAGSCALQCQQGLVECDSICIDPNTNQQYCGASNTCSGGVACPLGTLCNGAGECELSCPDGLVECDGTCIDPNTNHDYCGAIGDCLDGNAGTTCQPGFVCNGAGACELSCQDTLLDCGGTCIDPKTEESFCGATADCANGNVGVVCEQGHLCVDGQCELSCPANLIDCDGNCINPQSDPVYCGASGDCQNENDGVDCGAEEACVSGSCIAVGNCFGGLVTNDNDPKFPGAGIVGPWFFNGFLGTQAGDEMCQAAGYDHVCTFAQLQTANSLGETASLPDGTIWVHRVAAAVKIDAMGNLDPAGTLTVAGAGGRCNDWTYPTNHLADGEYLEVLNGEQIWHLDHNTCYTGDPNDMCQGNGPADGGQCHVRRAIPCCLAGCN